MLHVVLWQRTGKILKDNGLVHYVDTVNTSHGRSLFWLEIHSDFFSRAEKCSCAAFVGLETFREVALHDLNLVSALTADMMPLTTKGNHL